MEKLSLTRQDLINFGNYVLSDARKNEVRERFEKRGYTAPDNNKVDNQDVEDWLYNHGEFNEAAVTENDAIAENLGAKETSGPEDAFNGEPDNGEGIITEGYGTLEHLDSILSTNTTNTAEALPEGEGDEKKGEYENDTREAPLPPRGGGGSGGGLGQSYPS